jgi:hypothetical protein
MKVIITESQYNRIIDQFITYMFEPHEEMTYKNYPDYIYWIKSGEVIAEIQKSNNFFWLDDYTWKKISDMFGLDYGGTHSVISTWLEQHYNLGELIPAYVKDAGPLFLEEHYKLG